jgi:hypothetical protein
MNRPTLERLVSYPIEIALVQRRRKLQGQLRGLLGNLPACMVKQ